MLCVSFRCAFLALCALAALLPTFERGAAPARAESFSGWPAEWEGEALREVPLSARELQFNSNFPGRIAKFTDGRRELILRWVTQGTRQLHGSADCFRGLGYSVTPQPGINDGKRGMWSSFTAQRDAWLTASERSRRDAVKAGTYQPGPIQFEDDAAKAAAGAAGAR